MSAPQAKATVQRDDDRVCVTEWRFAPGAHTGWHRHEYDYIIVPITTGRLRIVTADGESMADLVVGQSYSREAGVEHDVFNAMDKEFVFLEIELK